MPLAVAPGDAFIATSFAAESSFAALDSRLSSLFYVLSASGFSLGTIFPFLCYSLFSIFNIYVFYVYYLCLCLCPVACRT